MDRQRLLTIFGAAWVSAALLTWFLYSRTAAPKQDKTVKVVAAARDLAAGEKIDKDKLKLITVAEKDVPRGAVLSMNELLGRAVLYPVSVGEPVSNSRVTSTTGAEGIAATIPQGMRAMSVPFTDATGASGLIQPRAHVDVLFTRTGNAVEAMTVTVLENVDVLSIGLKTVVDPAPPPGTTAKTSVGSSNQNRTATLLVTPDQAQKLELARNQGKISLSLRNPIDSGTRSQASPALMEEIDPLLLDRTMQGRRGAVRPAPGAVRDPKAWAQLIGDENAAKLAAAAKPAPEKKEPPKPRVVVDVFRGDKHVQEMFQ
ncbi:MAG: Flp pilus assembly protein CpaB [Bryobacterales bacterium]|nr:Flp pilus assembly protein CpaB [Bryobacterales bacterium]